jgi:hypothetical protein
MGSVEWFTFLDLHNGFRQIRMNSKDVKKKTFITKKGHYEWLVMSFGLNNTTNIFSKTMTNIFSKWL